MKTIKLPTSTLEKYCDIYFCKSENLLRKIHIQNDALVYQRTLHNSIVFKHIKDNLFTVKGFEHVVTEFQVDPKSMIFKEENKPDLVFTSYEGTLDSCPACLGKAHIVFDKHEKQYKVNCFDKCGLYTIGDLDSFNSLSDKHREWLVALNNNLSYNHIQNFYYDESIKWIIEEYELIEVVAEELGFTDISIEYAGGCDGPDPMYIIKTKDKKYSIRLYNSEYDLSIIETEIYWQNYLSEQGITFAPIYKDSSGKQIQYTNSLKKYSVLREWIEGEPLFNLDQKVLPDDLPEQLGKLLANMHKAALTIKLPENSTFIKRGYSFYEEFYKGYLKGDFDSESEKEEFIRIYTNFLEALKKLDKLDDQMALIHGDITTRNIIYDSGKYIPIDFKQIKYDYLLLDIVQLFLYKLSNEDHKKFWDGYERVRKVPEKWKELYPALMEAIGLGLIRVEDKQD